MAGAHVKYNLDNLSKLHIVETIQISLPNSPDNFLLVEMCERLKEGMEVTMLFGGCSMLPLINGEGDKIKLRPLADKEKCVPGEVYLFFYNNHYIIHRLLKIRDGVHVFRGDNCYSNEEVPREQVLAKLMTIYRPDGSEVDCEGEWWHKASRRVLCRRRVRSIIVKLANSQARRRWAVLYFVLLAVLMWAPLNGLGDVLNRLVFGLRLDHLLHGAVYLLCPFFLMDFLNYRKWHILLLAVVIGLFTEFVQYLLPYRGFDVNDLIANAAGCLLGWLAILPFLRRRRK